MERLKNFISDHKVEVGLAIFGSSLAIFWFLQRKHVRRNFKTQLKFIANL